MVDRPMLCLAVSVPVMPLQSPHSVYRRSLGAQVGVQSPQPLARRVTLVAQVIAAEEPPLTGGALPSA